MAKTLSELLERFPEVLEERGEYLVPCVVHEDGNPSLAFRLKGDGRLLVRCWAGCDQDKILAALGLTRRDLFDWTPGEGIQASAKATPGDVPVGDLAALAMYVDQTSQSLLLSETATGYVADRFGLDEDTALRLSLGVDWPGSTFLFPHRGVKFQRFPRLTVPLHDFAGNPRGLQGRDLSGQCPDRWLSITNPEGAAWSKFGYFRAGDGDSPVILTEGPSDALTAVGAGFDAVAVRGASLAGSEALVTSLVDGLTGRTVVIAGDNDTAGKSFTTALADALVREGIHVRVLGIPESGWDLTDWRHDSPESFPEILATEIDYAPLHVVDPKPTPPTTPAEPARKERRRMRPFAMTDLGNAERLYHQLGGHVRKVEGADVFKWDGKKWAQVPTEALYADVRAVIDNMMSEEGQDPERLGKWWAASQDARKVKAMVEMLSSIPGVYARVDQFDSKPHLLPFANGVVDLRDGSLRPHDPADMNTFCLDVDYNSRARAPRWEAFLQSCHPNSPEMPEFLQTMTGYGITGSGVERAVIMHVGPTTNGKTTFTAALEETFLEATKRADASLFMRRRESGGPRADVVGLRGARLVISSEWPADMKLDQALMKAISGDQTITARGVYARTEITFKPTCLVQVDSNYTPEVDATDAAIWQRVHVVPWLEDFRNREDRTLAAALRQEREGIAAWSVAGAIRWYALNRAGKGLEYPEVVRTATSGYRESSHPLAGFVGGDEPEYVIHEGGFVPRALAWSRYVGWAEESGIRHTVTRNRFYEMMRSIPGVTEGQGAGVHTGKRGYKGIEEANKVADAESADPNAPTDLFRQARTRVS
ncbi:phage/plasmid primase, P4 family [Streptomyces antimycoticus]|uniref:phage/plasmid primase, P4 family n=1 Tax=Streptomyces antimycoticus TaxID=68175 RepID=UPI0034476BA6